MSWSDQHQGSPAAAADFPPDDPNEILVFGYGCKLFRDDEKAGWIDKEEHLIPCMGDSSLKVDRYDGRGAIMDLRPFVPPPRPHGYNLDQELSPEERELERMLNEERYIDLKEDAEYNDMDYQEVEFQKFQSDVNGQGQYAAIGYSYDEKENEQVPAYPEPKKVDDLPYVNPPGLIIPDDIVLPLTLKLHAIIEKTAKFIASTGNQMEIILKTKQSGNSLFNFLEYRDSLNPYYKFLVQAIRTNAYTPTEDSVEVQLDSPAPTTLGEGSGSDDDDEGYLHPSLFKASSSPVEPVSALIKYKPPTGPTAYSLLVSKIKGSSATAETTPPAEDSFFYYNNSVNSPSSSFGYPDYPETDNDMQTDNDSSSAPIITSRPKNKVPSEQDQQVIEKMASYVVKNGPAFEELARTRGDPRFVFLDSAHEYHWYYLNCKERFKAETSSVVARGNFVKYNSNDPDSNNISSSGASVSSKSSEIVKRITPKLTSLPSITLPLSASGIPIANHASFSSRPTTIPPEVASRIEEIRKKKDLLKKEQEGAAKKEFKSKIQFSSSICKNMPIGSTGGIDEDTIIVVGDSSTLLVVAPVTGDNSTELCDEKQSDDKIQEASSEEVAKTKKALSIQEKQKSKETEKPKSELIEKNSVKSSHDEEETERRLKEERRRKAALFLMRLNSKKSKSLGDSDMSNVSSSVLSIRNNQSESCVKEVDRDSDVEFVESIPDPGETSKNLTENDLKGNGSLLEVKKRLHRESSSSSIEILKRKHNGSSSRHFTRSRSRSRSNSRRSNYIRRSHSSSSSSSHSHSKRSKRKHSKKRKKKREKEKSYSSSHSKKSKKRKYER